MVRDDKMTHRRLVFALTGALLLIMVMPLAIFASDITNARYFGNILITNTSTAATNVATTATISTPDLIAGGFSNATASDIVVRNSAGADAIFMPGFGDSDPWSFWVPSIGANAIQTYIFYSTNSTGQDVKYFPADGGMAVTDHASLELSNDFDVSIQGWIDTSATVGSNIIIKEDAFRTYVSASGEITAAIPSTIGFIPGDHVSLDFERGNSDYVRVADHSDFSFTDGNDLPFSAIIWVYLETVASGSFLSKDAAGEQEWYCYTSSDNTIRFIIYDDATGGFVGRKTNSAAGLAGAWHHFAFTYDGTETSAGANIYVDGIDADTSDHESGVFNGMTNGSADVEIGAKSAGGSSFLDGVVERAKIYDVELTPSEVLADFNGTHKATDLVALWLIDEGTGNPADSSGNGHDATANLADWLADDFVAATGIDAGDIILSVAADTSDLTISINGSVEDTATLVGTVPDNADPWEFAGDGSVLYMTTANVTVSGTLAGSWEWEYTATFTDDSVNSNTATPTFRAASSNANVTANLTTFRPIAEAQAPAFSLGTAPDFIDSDALTGNVTGTFGTTPSAGSFPLANVITSIADATSTPAQLPLMIIAAFIILAASLSISALMRRHGSGTLNIKLGVIVTFLGIFIALANFGIDFWMLVLFLVISVGLSMASRQLGW